MAARISQAYITVAGQQPQTANIRVYRMYADVLVQTSSTNTHNMSASSNMTLNHSATYTGTFGKSASNTINLTQNVTESIFNQDQDVDSVLSLVSSASAAMVRPIAIAHTLTLTSVGGRTLTLDASNNITLLDSEGHFNYVADRTPAGSVITLTQCVEVAGSKVVEHSLGLTQTVNVQYPYRLSVLTPLVIAQHTSTPYHFWVEDEMVIRHWATVPLPTQHLSHTLNLVQNSPIGSTWDTLNLTQCVQFSFSLTAASTMNLTDQVDLEGLWVRSVAHSSIVGHALTWYEDTPCGRKRYTPFQGENTIVSDFTPPSNVLQDPQGDTGNFSLYTPYLGVATNKVTLRKPELDNRDRNAYTRVNQETRGGKLIVYSDPQWPHVRTLAVTIIGLLESEVDELQDFMEDTLGQEIGLTDWEGRLWKGVIINPNEAAVQDGKKRWTVTFEFEGEMLDVQQPGDNDGTGDGQTMAITQSVTAVIV